MRYRLTYALVALFAVLATLVPGLASATGGASISGLIRSTAGTPVPDVCVSALTRSGDSLAHAQSLEDGSYTLTGLVKGDYRVRVRDCSPWGPDPVIGERYHPDATSLEAASPVVLLQDEARTDVNVVVVRNGVLSGAVTTAEGDALEGICVQAHSPTGHVAGEAKTDISGAYRIGKLVGADYKLRFQDCAPGGEYMTEWYENAASAATAKPVTVDPEEPVVGPTAVLGLGRRISGTVSERDGPAVSGACVQLYDASGTHIKYASADAEGKYRFGGLQPASYKLQVHSCRYPDDGLIGGWYGGGFDHSTATAIDVSSQDQVVPLELLRRATIQGVVSDVDGPIADACVSLTNGTNSYSARTGSNGAYSASVTPGTYKVYAYACGTGTGYGTRWHPSASTEAGATSVPVASGGTVSNIDVVLVKASIAGTVKDSAGNPLAGICVSSSMYSTAQVKTATDGSFTLRVNGAGTYELVYTDCAADAYTSQRRMVTVGDGQSFTGADAVMAKHATVTGKVVDSKGVGLAGICVNGSMPYGGPGVPSGYGYATTNADGVYSFRPSLPGTYTITFNSCGYNQDIESTQVSASVPSGAITTVNMTLKRRPSISGRVVDSAGLPIRDVCVSSQAPMYGSARTDADGRFRMSQVAVGDHRVQFSDCSGEGRYLSEWHFDARTAAKAAIVTVAPEAQVVLAEAKLAPAGRLTGLVTDESTGKSLSGACVSAHDRAGTLVAQGRTNLDGTYVIGGLPTAAYRIQFALCPNMYGAPASHEPEWHFDATSFAGASPVNVAAGFTVTVNAGLRGLARAAGTVTDGADGLGIAGVCVTGRLADGREVSFGQTDVSGDYVSGFVPAGSYVVRYEDCAVPVVYATRWWPNAITAESATTVVLSPSGLKADLDQVMQDGRTIGVTSPNGGESYIAGSKQTITWRSTGDVGATVKIELIAADGATSVLADSAPAGVGGSGSAAWTAPSTPAEGFTVRVTSVAVPTAKDVSDQPFSVIPAAAPKPAAGTVSVTSPDGGETWVRGATEQIAWAFTGAVGTHVKVELLRGTAVAATLVRSQPVGVDGKGHFAWTLAKTLKAGHDYRIRVTSTTDGTVTDASGSFFTIS